MPQCTWGMVTATMCPDTCGFTVVYSAAQLITYEASTYFLLFSSTSSFFFTYSVTRCLTSEGWSIVPFLLGHQRRHKTRCSEFTFLFLNMNQKLSGHYMVSEVISFTVVLPHNLQTVFFTWQELCVFSFRLLDLCMQDHYHSSRGAVTNSIRRYACLFFYSKSKWLLGEKNSYQTVSVHSMSTHMMRHILWETAAVSDDANDDDSWDTNLWITRENHWGLGVGVSI